MLNAKKETACHCMDIKTLRKSSPPVLLLINKVSTGKRREEGRERLRGIYRFTSRAVTKAYASCIGLFCVDTQVVCGRKCLRKGFEDLNLTVIVMHNPREGITHYRCHITPHVIKLHWRMLHISHVLCDPAPRTVMTITLRRTIIIISAPTRV